MEDLKAVMERFQENSPALAQAFQQFSQTVLSEGVLSAKTKRLILVGIATAIRCEPCIHAHVAGALAEGATREEIIEAAGTAALLGGGPAVAYNAIHVMKALDEYQAGE